jgi:hypothetical protein
MSVREYRFVVEGELGDGLGSAFAGMTLTRKEGKTLLVGQVRDQAELQGLLRRVSDLGLTLLSASTTAEDERADDGPFAPDTVRASTEAAAGKNS